MTSILRLLGAILTLACVAAALHSFDIYAKPGSHWWWLGAALLAAIVWQWRLPLLGTVVDVPPREPASRKRIALGLAIGLAGAVLWGAAIRGLYESWTANFDHSWLALPIGAAAMAIGFDLACGRWPRRNGPAPVGRLILGLLGLLALAAVYRLWNLADVPGPAGITQVEELQTGMWGVGFLNGSRLRWEYLSSTWLSALGIWMGGPTLNAMRLPFTLVSILKVLPIFFWLRFAVGTVGALVGTALFVFSAWDVVLSRIPTNHNALVVATVFALLAGPARRGRPSAYVWLGLFAGYVLYEYVAFRPLAFFALAGAVWLSLQDAHAGWLLRLGRPLITLVLVISMAVPLFLAVLSPPHRIWNEYFNGWNRARAQVAYYDPDDTWSKAIQRRVDRSYEAAGLFFFSGDPHPARQVEQPLVDPVTAAFLVVGLGCAIAHATEPIFGLTLIALLATAAGSLVMTGNLDVVRVGGAVPYIYALAAYGAASLAALARARGRPVRLAALGLLAAAVIWAGWLNTQALLGHWSSTSVRRASRSNLALLSGWLGTNVRDGERVIAVAPGFFNVLHANDASWLRRREMEGLAAWDVESALRYWVENPGGAVLVAFAGPSTTAVKAYLEWRLPGVTLELQPDPLKADGDLAYAHLDAVPPQLAAAARRPCRGVTAEYRLVGAQPEEPPHRVTSFAPFVDTSTMPGSLREQVYRSQPPVSRVLARYQASFVLPAAGEYRFQVQSYPGQAELRLDGQPYRHGSQRKLQAGAHSLEIEASLEPLPTQMSVRLLWSTPPNRTEWEIMPIYRLSAADPACRRAAAAARAAASPS